MANPRAVNFKPNRRGRLFKTEEPNIDQQSFEETLTPEDSTLTTPTLGKRSRAAAPPLSIFNKRDRQAPSLEAATNAYHQQVDFIINNPELKLITNPLAKKEFVSKALIWVADAYRTQKIVNTKVVSRKVNRPLISLTSLMLDAWELASLMKNPQAVGSLQSYIAKNQVLYYRIQCDKYGLPEEFKNNNLNVKMIVAGEDNEGEVSDEVILDNLNKLDKFLEEKMLNGLNALIQAADKTWWTLLENFLNKQMTEIAKHFPEKQAEFLTDLKDAICTGFEEWVIENVNNPIRTEAILTTRKRK